MTERDERGWFEWGYGFFGNGDPRDFEPDRELCTPEEIARWEADCKIAERDNGLTALPAGLFVYNEDGRLPMHILRPPYGIGTYKYRLTDEEAAESDDLP